MTAEEMKQLKPGDIVKHLYDSRTFVVTGNYGGRVTAVATVDITNNAEWEVVIERPALETINQKEFVTGSRVYARRVALGMKRQSPSME